MSLSLSEDVGVSGTDRFSRENETYPVLTIFSIPKPFRGRIGTIQTNAIRSWLSLRPECEIILFGDEEGTAGVAREFGLRHIPTVACNEHGTPLLSHVFQATEELASHQLLCYVNTDIIVFSDLIAALQQVRFRRFLMIGRRYDLEAEGSVDFSQLDWEKKLRKQAQKFGSLHPPLGSDYFVFPKYVVGSLPAFAVGRPCWDNWLIYRARALRIPVVDATDAVMMVHQNHDYLHVPASKTSSWEGPEGDRNRELAGGSEFIFVLADATHKLGKDGLSKALDDLHLDQRLKRQPVLDEGTGFVSLVRRAAARTVSALARPISHRLWQKVIFSLSK